jgi:hypothetical protein
MENELKIDFFSYEFKKHTRDFINSLDKLILPNPKVSFEEFTKNLSNFTPYRNNYLKELKEILERNITCTPKIIHNDLFEEALLKCSDNRKYNTEGINLIIYEIFLYAMSILLKEERFDIVSELLKREFSKSDISYSDNCDHIKTFQKIFYFCEELHCHGVLYINSKNSTCICKYENKLELIDADILIFLKTLTEKLKTHEFKNSRFWQPFTRIYITFGDRSPLFKKCTSKDFYKKLWVIFGDSLEADLDTIRLKIDNEKFSNPFNCRMPIHSPKLSDYININHLGTRE